MAVKVFEKIGVGLDVSKKHIDACFMVVVEGRRKVGATKKFRNTLEGHQALEVWIKKHQRESSAPMRISMETTGVYHESVLNFFYEAGYEVSLVPAKLIKHFAISLGVKTKTDKIDSKVIARFSIDRNFKLWKPASPNILRIREMFRALKQLKDSKSRFMNQIHAVQFSNGKNKKVLASLKRMVKHLEQEIAKLEALILSTAKKDKAFFEKAEMIADSIKGLGIQTVIKLAAETNGFEDFRGVRQLVSFAGFDVVENSSGDRVGRTRISKQGNARIRQALYMPVLSIIKHRVAPFIGLYDRVLERHGGKQQKKGKVAIVAVMRKLLGIIYALWTKNEAFDPEYHLNNTHKEVAQAYA